MSVATQVSALATRVGSEAKSLWTAVSLKAPLASPTFTGAPSAPTPAAGSNTTAIATTAFVTTALAGGSGVKSFVQATQPASLATGDLWLDTTATI